MQSFIRPLAALTLAAAAVPAQIGGFSDGDMYLYSRNVHGMGSQDGAILTVDPISGQTASLVDFASFASYGRGSMAYDSYRKALVFYTSIDDGGPQYGLWMASADGSLERAVPNPPPIHGLAPTGRGSIYVLVPSSGASPIRHFDGANRLVPLYDETGESAFAFPGIVGINDSVMTYHAGSHALFIAYRGSSGPSCVGGSAYGITIRKVPLSADGTRVDGPVECIEHQADLVQSMEVPANWSRGPGDTLVLVCDTPGVGSDAKPRIALVDPLVFGVTTWAEPGGFPGADQITAGSYSSQRGDVLVLDSLNDRMRGYTQGGSGGGSELLPVGPLSATPGSGDLATLVEVDNGPCSGAFQPVGVGLKGTGNQVPGLMASGCAAVGGELTLQVRDVVGGATGALAISVNEGAVDFKGGQLYMTTIDSLLWFPVGGVEGEAGAGDVDLHFGTLTEPLLTGLDVIVQAGFFDDGAILGASLSQAVRLRFE